MYPKFVEQAREENESEALASFQNAMTVEQVHGSLYIEALSAVESGKDLRSVKIFVCGVCGNTVFDSVPVKCPVCSASSEKFTEVE
jgi:rubrerythrin